MINLNRMSAIPLKYANRHGLITGQTGTGKTVTLQRLAEQFSKAGVPVFISDVKGDIGALSRSCPTTFYDLFGKTGQPLPVSIESMGPDLMARALELSDVQAGVLEIAVQAAHAHETSIYTLRDLRATMQNVLECRDRVSRDFGQVGTSSIGVIQRACMRLESQGAVDFFSADTFDVARLIDTRGVTSPAGMVSILQAEKLLQSPRVYAAFLLWLLRELYQRMPEVGDLDQPRLVLFFDEAHLIFQDCPAALLQRIEQTVRLIRSKGVGVYFVSQRPDDVPAVIRSQLAHTIAHDRALSVGTAIFSTMTAAGLPLAAKRIKIDLPDCPLGALDAAERVQALPVSTTAPAAVQGEFDSAGYIFLAVAAFTLVGAVWAMWSLHTAGETGIAVACIVGAYLAVRKKL